MKFRHWLAGAGLAIALGATSHAIPPPDGGVLGQVDAILGFCGKVSPQSQQQYGELRKALTAGRTEKEIADIEATAEYREAFEAVQAALNAVPANEAVQTCAKALQAF
ncbi:MAG: hypothetical protein ACRET4_03745 [Steroidobacteraceae bacterium]